MSEHHPIILASTSPYRRELLSRLGLTFAAKKPGIDEEAEKDPALAPRALAEKLARMKAQSLADGGSIVIGGDQLVQLDGKVLGKPGTEERALEQLRSMRGRTHELITAIYVVHPHGDVAWTDITRLTMRNLSDEQLLSVIHRDQPLDCAGAYKIEGMGVAMMEKIETEDFTAIQGLPLIALSRILEGMGVSCPPKHA